jgi:hypothetical protein
MPPSTLSDRFAAARRKLQNDGTGRMTDHDEHAIFRTREPTALQRQKTTIRRSRLAIANDMFDLIPH